MKSAGVERRAAGHPIYLRIAFSIFSMFVLLPLATQAKSDVGAGDLYALIVGVSKYKHPKIRQLTVSDKDAKDFAEFLKTQNKLFRNVHVTLLRNEDATKAEVEKNLYYKLRQAGKDDTVMLFFSGHGADDPYTPGEFFFLTHDAEPEYLAATAVHMSRQWFLSKLDSRRVVLIADACHAGGFSLQGAKGNPPSFQNVIQQFKESEGRVFLTSSRPDELSLEKPGMSNSIFTHYLLQGLKGEADTDKDGVVTIKELYDYVYQKTKDETKGYQRPQMEGRIVGAFPMALEDSSALMAELSEKYSARILDLTAMFDKSSEFAGDRLEKTYLEEKAAKWIRMAAEQGIPQAQFNLGRMYDKGIGVPRDQVAAVNWYRKAAEHGVSSAQNSLGLCYQEGRSVQRDYSKAVKFYSKAADSGNLDAQNNLGNAYFQGHGVSKDPAKAIQYWVKATEKGHEGARQNLANYLREDISRNRSEDIKKHEEELLRTRAELEKLRRERNAPAPIPSHVEHVKPERERASVKPPSRGPSLQKPQARQPAESDADTASRKENSDLTTPQNKPELWNNMGGGGLLNTGRWGRDPDFPAAPH